jgi:hypothetical protein
MVHDLWYMLYMVGTWLVGYGTWLMHGMVHVLVHG